MDELEVLYTNEKERYGGDGDGDGDVFRWMCV